MNALVLPEWDDCQKHYLNGTASPLEVFLYNNEPVEDAARFRLELREAIEEVLTAQEIESKGRTLTLTVGEKGRSDMGTDAERAVPSEVLLAEAVDIMRCLVDPDPCRYDHHDNCQAHSLGVRPCEHEQAKAFIAKYDAANTERHAPIGAR